MKYCVIIDKCFIFQVCTNGLVCLGEYITAYTPTPFPLNNEDMGVIAPYWGDADPSKGGTVWSRVSTDEGLLSNVSSLSKYCKVSRSRWCIGLTCFRQWR